MPFPRFSFVHKMTRSIENRPAEIRARFSGNVLSVNLLAGMLHGNRCCQATLFPECFRKILSMCAWSAASILVLASSKLLPRTVSDSSSQTPFQPLSSSQKLQSFGTLANTLSFTARAVIDDSFFDSH
jgi:hypothetical protein